MTTDLSAPDQSSLVVILCLSIVSLKCKHPEKSRAKMRCNDTPQKANAYFLGHPPAMDTSQDGQYESGVRERVNLTPMPGRSAGQR